jgi:DNA modification methylase
MLDVSVLVPEYTTVWSFPERGNWATHNPSYRGNFAPQIPRNIIEMYSEKGENILDPMVGGGTTLIEAKLLCRNALGIDINPKAVKFSEEVLNSFDLILTHPPYLNIIKYSDGKIDGDISNIGSMPQFCDEIEKIAAELFRVLKPDKYCAILIGDTRKGKHYVPLSMHVLRRFLKVGFVLKEDIVKVQHNCATTHCWQSKALRDRFYLIMHEHLYVFRKPLPDENLARIKYSCSL